MLKNLVAQPEDKIIALAAKFRADPRDTKIDLGVGVYKDASGTTPVMKAIKSAEQALWETEASKSYTNILGDPAFHSAMSDLLLDGAVENERLSFAHTPGGTGAVRQILELIKRADPETTIWMSDPTWPNHPAIIKYVGLPMQTYRYFDAETRGVNFEGILEDLSKAKAGDVVLLHGCCHNPTGANLNNAQWKELADFLVERGLVPFIDIAYQGFGDGLEEDAFATRLIAKTAPEVLIAASCSKNFGIYRERTGLVVAISQTAADAKMTTDNLSSLNRLNFSFPPDHGSRLVTNILTDASLRNEWETELAAMRSGMIKNRKLLADALRAESGSDRFGFIAEHRGMFSRLGTSPENVDRLREEFGIYMIGDSRLNIAGVKEKDIPLLAEAFIKVCG